MIVCPYPQPNWDFGIGECAREITVLGHCLSEVGDKRIKIASGDEGLGTLRLKIGRTGRWSSQILYNFDGYLIIYRCNNFWHGIDPQLVGSMNVEVRRNQTQIEFRWLDIWIGTLDRVLSVDPPAIAADIKNKAEFSMDKSFFLRWAHEPFISG